MARRGSYAKGVAKRGEILDAALTVIGRDGYSRATVREIADAVGLSQNGLLHHFGSKERLFVEVLRHRDELDVLVYGEGARRRPGAVGQGADAADRLPDGQRPDDQRPDAVGQDSGAADGPPGAVGGRSEAADGPPGATDGPPEAADGRPDIGESLVRLVRHNAEVPGLVQLYSRLSTEAAEEGHPARDFFRERYARGREAIAEEIRRLQGEGELPAGQDADRLAVLGLALMDGLQVQWSYDSGVDMADHMAYFLGLVGLRPAVPNPSGEGSGP
ncbi:TetR family transcriptional regulator [Nocardiopsis alborubida]|uniref:TetR family transcriptional regulator n=1 Tax=Nocardiopsis alborubida TaxID=146802 RepID=UPI000B3351A2|nr:TetR/AcrR family transcriptional regulator [Nocardiopsis alborubida]